MQKRILVLGGTSGLGEELARAAACADYSVTVAGLLPTNCQLVKQGYAEPLELNLTVDQIVLPEDLGPFDAVIWAAGAQYKKRFENHSRQEVRDMCRLLLEGPCMVLTEIIKRQKAATRPFHLVVIGSTGVWRIRGEEALYGALKAAQAHLTRNLSACLPDELPGTKLLLANPGAMRTPFWAHDTETDTSVFMDPCIVANLIWDEMQRQTTPFREIQIIRQPPDGSPKLIEGACLPV